MGHEYDEIIFLKIRLKKKRIKILWRRKIVQDVGKIRGVMSFLKEGNFATIARKHNMEHKMEKRAYARKVRSAEYSIACPICNSRLCNKHAFKKHEQKFEVFRFLFGAEATLT